MGRNPRGTTVSREDTARTAAQTIASSNNHTEVLQAYHQLGAALVAPLTCADEIAGILVDTVTERLPTSPVHARALVLLGILVEQHGTDIAVSRLLRTVSPALGNAAVLAMAYLLAHFPDHAAPVLDTMRATGLSEMDLKRLERCLAPPGALDRIGRVWPSPTVWRLDAAEQQLDQAWRAGLQLDADTAKTLWEAETVALLAYMGAKADHAVERTEHA